MKNKMGIKVKSVIMSCILGVSLFGSTSVFAKSNINRLAGQDRYGTSNAIVSQGWTKSDYAVLVNSQNFPDAITSSPLAKKYNAPILLTHPNILTDSTKEKLQSLGVKNVFIIGGTGVISSDIENTLASMNINIKRIWGMNRYETSVNVAKELGSSKGVFVVNGEHYEDALAAAPIADRLQYPIILVGQNNVPDTVANYINNQVKTNNGEVVVIGGQDVLTDNIVRTLKPTKTYNQSSKYDRNLALIDNYKKQLELSTIYIASDKGFADALSGSALAGKNGNPIILLGDSNQKNVNVFINNNNIDNINVLGGIGVLSDSIIANILGSNENTHVPTITSTSSSAIIKINNNIIDSVNQGDSYSLPKAVQATMSDGTTKSVSVTWDKQAYAWNNQPDTRQIGKFTFNGTVSGYNGDIVLTLNVYGDMSSILKPYSNGLNDVHTNADMYLAYTPYKHGYMLGLDNTVECSFNLDGNYNHISALIGVDDYALALDGEIDVTVYGDDKILVPTYKLIKREAQSLELDVTGVKQLKFVKSGPGKVDIVNPQIN